MNERPPRKGTPLGRWGEQKALEYLQAQGYQLLAQNWRRREGELDLVALDGTTLVFFEVKTRRSDTLGAPEESVDARKQAQIVRVAQRFIDEHPALRFGECRFDVLVIDLRHEPPQVRHLVNAFLPSD